MSAGVHASDRDVWLSLGRGVARAALFPPWFVRFGVGRLSSGSGTEGGAGGEVYWCMKLLLFFWLRLSELGQLGFSAMYFVKSLSAFFSCEKKHRVRISLPSDSLYSP